MSLNGRQTLGSHKCEATNNQLSVQDQLVRAVTIRTCSVTRLSPGQRLTDALVVNSSPFVTDTFACSLMCSCSWPTGAVSVQ